MSRNSRNILESSQLLDQLATIGKYAPTIKQKVQLLEFLRGKSAESAKHADQFLIEQLCSLRLALDKAQDTQEKLREIHKRLTSPPYFPATFLATEEVGRGRSAMVMHGNTRRVVTCEKESTLDELSPGEEVLLSNELNFIVERSPYSVIHHGQTGFFDRWTGDGRMVLKDRDEEIVVGIVNDLVGADLKRGDQIRWEQNTWLALEKIERSRGDDLFLEETPKETFADIGGLECQIEQLQRPICLHVHHPEIVKRYKLPRIGSVLLSGPPGTGKTMISRALANWLASLSESGRARFMHIKPLELSSMWYSESERNIRNTFRMAREAGDAEPKVPVVVFFDEVDSIGTTRGASWMRVDDKVLTSLMAELDGLESRGNILVVAATNRKDTLDPALIRQGRLGDLPIEVPRPNMRAATDIFYKHLPISIPYSVDGRDQSQARQYIIESAVSRIYSPNGEGNIAQITFRDGKRRTIMAPELMNGASIAKIVRIAIERACLRHAEEESSGVRVEDIFYGLDEELECLRGTLSPANCRNYLLDLPQDIDVVRVEPIQRKVKRSYRYTNAA